MTVSLSCSVVPRRAAGVLLLCAGVLLAPGASAAKNATLYKCVDAAGVTSIQSNPCPAGSTQAWRRDAPTEPAPTPEQTAQADAKRMRDQQAVRELSEIVDKKLQVASGVAAAAAAAPPALVPMPAGTEATPSASSEAAAVEACQKAQAFAASVREQAWLALSEEQVRRVYGWVAEQCKLPAPAN
jgi:hypothetical protein